MKIANDWFHRTMIEGSKGSQPSVPHFRHLGKRACPWCGKPTFWLPTLDPASAYEICSACDYFMTRTAPEGLKSSKYKETKHSRPQGFTLVE